MLPTDPKARVSSRGQLTWFSGPRQSTVGKKLRSASFWKRPQNHYLPLQTHCCQIHRLNACEDCERTAGSCWAWCEDCLFPQSRLTTFPFRRRQQVDKMACLTGKVLQYELEIRAFTSTTSAKTRWPALSRWWSSLPAKRCRLCPPYGRAHN